MIFLINSCNNYIDINSIDEPTLEEILKSGEIHNEALDFILSNLAKDINNGKVDLKSFEK